MIETGALRRIKIGLKLAGLLPAFLIGLPAQWLALKFAPRAALWLPVLFHRYLLLVLGVRVERQGTRGTLRPLMIASNHLSWLDIIVISSLFPVSFIAKSEVGDWPLFGTLARLQRSIFVERSRRGKTAEVNRAIAERMLAGDAMVLFAEGTTSDGARILPFRSALIGAAQAALGARDDLAYIQPLNIVYPRLGGLPIARADHPHIAWHGDMDLLPHLADFLTLHGITARVTLGEARPIHAESDRKALTSALESEIRSHHTMALTGRARMSQPDEK